jgi:serine/threonine protein kinase
MGAYASTNLEDKYFLQKVKLGQGSFGVVWRGVEKTTSMPVAVKQMDKAQLPRRGVKREDIEREVSVMKVVVHENILRLYDFCEDQQYISFVLEYCDGGDFGDKVKEREKNVTEEEAAKWMKQILSAIQALHSKDVCHRDIKPDNFMVSSSWVIKLADFGLATILPKGKLLSEKCGTPAFMAPEQMNISSGKSRGYNHSVDMWASGITMFMLMSGGKHPFVSTDGKLDERRLADGVLDFASQGVFALFAQQGCFSEEAKAFCRKMVNPNQQTRITADKAVLDSWMKVAAIAAGGDITRRGSDATPISRQRSGQQGGGATPTAAVTPVAGINAIIGGWNPFGFGDQNKEPNVRTDDQDKDRQRYEVLNSQLAAANRDPKGINRENSMLKKQIEDMTREREELTRKLAKTERIKPKAGYPGGEAAAGSTMRDGYEQPALSRRMTDLQPGMKVPMTSLTGVVADGKLPPSLKVRYNSASAKCWLTAQVISFNDLDGTYNLDVRQHADVSNISPDPSVKRDEAWPPQTLVSYHSSSAGRWLDAIIVSYAEGTGGLMGTYNLDCRECAEVERIRPRLRQ